MPRSAYYLDLLKEKLNVQSDYALSKELNLSRAKISNFRTGFRAFDDVTLFKVAEALGINPAVIQADLNLEKAKTPEKKKFWKETYSKIAGTAAAVILSSGLVANFGAISGTSGPVEAVNNIHYANPRRRRRISLAALFAVLVLPWGPVYADTWSTGDTIRETTWQTINFIDYRQTLQISKNCNSGGGLYEQNPLLSNCPSRSEVNRYFAVSAGLHWAISNYLPAKYRGPWQYVTLGVSGAVVAHNFHIGLKLNF